MPGYSPLIPQVAPAAAVLTFPRITVVTPELAAGATWAGSFPWADATVLGAVPIRQVGLVADPPTEAHLRILRRAIFTDPDMLGHVAFEAERIGEGFEREYLWDYEDEDHTSRLHLWIANTGNTAATFTLTLNDRDTPED